MQNSQMKLIWYENSQYMLNEGQHMHIEDQHNLVNIVF